MAEESIQSVKRTFLVLESLAGRGSAGVRELHGVVGLSVATVHRILSTLVDLGYVRRNPQTERYELTYKILVLGHSVTQHSGVIQLAHPLLEQLFEAQPRHEEVAEEDRQFFLYFYSYGVVKFFLYWVGNGMKPEPEQMMSRLNRLFDGSMEDFIRRYVESAEEKK